MFFFMLPDQTKCHCTVNSNSELLTWDFAHISRFHCSAVVEYAPTPKKTTPLLKRAWLTVSVVPASGADKEEGEEGERRPQLEPRHHHLPPPLEAMIWEARSWIHFHCCLSGALSSSSFTSFPHDLFLSIVWDAFLSLSLTHTHTSTSDIPPPRPWRKNTNTEFPFFCGSNLLKGLSFPGPKHEKKSFSSFFFIRKAMVAGSSGSSRWGKERETFFSYQEEVEGASIGIFLEGEGRKKEKKRFF